jgi:hypothetical protein
VRTGSLEREVRTTGVIFIRSRPSTGPSTNGKAVRKLKITRKSLPILVFGLIGLFWFALTLFALVESIRGGDPLYTAYPGGLVLPHYSLLGKIYLVSSALMPFIVIGAIATA